MSFSCPSQTIATDTEMNAPYRGTNPLLPSTTVDAAGRDTSGLMTQASVNQIISTLKSNGTIPNPDQADPAAYLAKQSTLLTNAKSEYCFYESRYKYALDKLFTAIRENYKTTSTNDTADVQTKINGLLEKTQKFNKNLNDLIQIMIAITDIMMTVNTSMDNEIDSYTRSLNEHQRRLQEQGNILNSNQATMKLNKQMVEYTEEKSRYTDNLMKMYSVLNIVAVGLLIYVYKAAGDE
jgi:paraquat-inducible protein B